MGFFSVSRSPSFPSIYIGGSIAERFTGGVALCSVGATREGGEVGYVDVRIKDVHVTECVQILLMSRAL